MSEPRKMKKSESLEIRIPFTTKAAFMARCRADGRSASEALRSYIEGQLVEPAKLRTGRTVSRRLHWIVGAVIAATVGAVALPSLARPNAVAAMPAPVRDLWAQAEFRRIDLNGDGAISADEYRRHYEALSH